MGHRTQTWRRTLRGLNRVRRRPGRARYRDGGAHPACQPPSRHSRLGYHRPIELDEFVESVAAKAIREMDANKDGSLSHAEVATPGVPGVKPGVKGDASLPALDVPRFGRAITGAKEVTI